MPNAASFFVDVPLICRINNSFPLSPSRPGRGKAGASAVPRQCLRGVQAAVRDGALSERRARRYAFVAGAGLAQQAAGRASGIAG